MRHTASSGEPTMETVDWRTQLPLESRKKVIHKIVSTLMHHLQSTTRPTLESLDKITKIAISFEEKVFMAASSQDDYLTKISSKLHQIESRSPNIIPNTANNSKPSDDPGFQGMQNRVHSQGQAIPSRLQGNQFQARQQLLPQNVPSNMASAGVQTCAPSQSGMPPVSGLTQNPISNGVGLNSHMWNRSGISQNSMRQGIPSHGYANQQREMEGKQQVLPQQQQLLINFSSSVPQQNMNPLLSNSNMLQQQHLKQPQEQQMLLSQEHLNQKYRRQLMQRRLLQEQQQQLHHQAKQQLPTELQTNQMPQLHQIIDVDDMIIRQEVGVNQGVLEQHLPAGQRQSYTRQLKKGSRVPFSSPQLLQASSPQMPQRPSQQVDQQSQRKSISKAGNRLHSANSPLVIPSPSTPLAPSPMPGESERHFPGKSAIPNAAIVGHNQGTGVQTVSQYHEIGTPGISASPVLAEFSTAGVNHASASETVSTNSNITEQPLTRLINAVKSVSPLALAAAVSEIGSVVSMTDNIAETAPSYGWRATIGQDLAAMTKCRLQARNFIVTGDGTSGTKKMRRDFSAMPWP